MIKQKFTLEEIKKFLKKKGFTISKNNNLNFFHRGLRNIYYTFLSSFGVILFFFMLPKFIDFQQNKILASKEIENKSKSNLEKVLKGEPLDDNSEADEKLNLKNLFEDVFKFDQLPTDTVRLNASTIEQLFKDTNYKILKTRANRKFSKRSTTKSSRKTRNGGFRRST